MLSGNSNYLYLTIELFSVLLPVIFSFHRRIRFDKEWKLFLLANIPVTAFFVFWDSVFTRNGIWGFNSEYIIGWKLFSLPVEEVFFFIAIPFASLFTLHVIKKTFTAEKVPVRLLNLLIGILCCMMFIYGVVSHFRVYTVYASLAAGTTLLITIKLNKEILPQFYKMTSFILIPFFIVNGILTGSGIDREVVWYNEAENIGVRMGTIPVEDLFYGFALLLLNVLLMEVLRERFSSKSLQHTQG